MTQVMERTFGVLDPETLATLCGREALEAMMRGELPAPPMAKTLNFALIEVGDGRVVFEGHPADAFRNPMGVVHGGWALALVDSAAGCAAMTLLPAGSGYTTIETKVNFSRPITVDTGRVQAEATIVGRGRRILSAEARVSDARGRMLAHGTSTLMVLSQRDGG